MGSFEPEVDNLGLNKGLTERPRGHRDLESSWRANARVLSPEVDDTRFSSRVDTAALTSRSLSLPGSWRRTMPAVVQDPEYLSENALIWREEANAETSTSRSISLTRSLNSEDSVSSLDIDEGGVAISSEGASGTQEVSLDAQLIDQVPQWTEDELNHYEEDAQYGEPIPKWL